MPSTRLALALLALLVAPACAVAQTTEATLSRAEITASPASTLSGRYRLVGGQDAIRRSIDAVCDELDFVTRAFARPILEDRNQPYTRVELAVDGASARFTLGPWGPVSTAFGAVRTVQNERGESTRVSQILVGRRLVQTFSTDQGTRRNVITVSEDGRRLTVDTLITSPRLPIPLRYRLSYVREGAPPDLRVALRS